MAARERRRLRRPQPAIDHDSVVASNIFSANDVVIVQFNLRGFLSKHAELASYVQLAGPDVVCLTETLLDPSIDEISLPGYRLVLRRDRDDGREGGGVAVFASDAIANNVVHIESSPSSERVWHIVHGIQGCFLLGVWYRPPEPGEVASIRSLDDDLTRLGGDCLFTIIVGDMNVHNREWLRFSSGGISREGRELHDTACTHGLEQLVREPTRGDNLLDFVLSDADCVSASVIPGFSDHLGTKVDVEMSMPEKETVDRVCFNYKKAAWGDLNTDLAAINWRQLLGGLNPDDAATVFSRELLRLVKRHVPSRTVATKKSSHPWLTDRCAEAVAAKLASVGTPSFEAKRDECSAILREEYERYIQKTKAELEEFAPSSKRWWSISNSLLRKAQSVSAIPSLKRRDGTWATTASEKATVLQETFVAKSVLPPKVVNEFTPFEADPILVDHVLSVETVDTEPVLKKLHFESGTGPDQISTRVLRNCASVLAEPVALLCNIIVDQGEWPQVWRQHWVCPIHKRKSKADPENYRGVHLTSQLSKVCERVLGSNFQRYFEVSGKYGPRQFAYMKGRGHRDALLANILQWLWWLESGKLVGLYCSDVSGAFDRVDRELLVRKIRSTGMSGCLARVLESWLEARVAEVVVGGQAAAPAPLRNSVYQGTVWGPPLWNLHYESSRHAVNSTDYFEVTYADDMNMSKPFANHTPFDDIHADMRICQDNLHRWGSGNSVLFDPGKEEFHVLTRPGASVDISVFRLLGVKVDSKLLMHQGVRALCVQAAWRVKALRRVRRFYSVRQMIHLYKSRVLSYVEAGCVAFFHAAPSVLEPLDRIQSRFLDFLGVSVERAFLDFNLAPLSVRRQMAALGLIHRCVLDKAPIAISAFFPRIGVRHVAYATRLEAARHDKQIVDKVRGSESQVFKRSLFGFARVYNRLPQGIVDSLSVGAFQRELQSAVRRCLVQRRHRQSWLLFLTRSMSSMDILRFQRYFVD